MQKCGNVKYACNAVVLLNSRGPDLQTTELNAALKVKLQLVILQV